MLHAVHHDLHRRLWHCCVWPVSCVLLSRNKPSITDSMHSMWFWILSCSWHINILLVFHSIHIPYMQVHLLAEISQATSQIWDHIIRYPSVLPWPDILCLLSMPSISSPSRVCPICVLPMTDFCSPDYWHRNNEQEINKGLETYSIKSLDHQPLTSKARGITVIVDTVMQQPFLCAVGQSRRWCLFWMLPTKEGKAWATTAWSHTTFNWHAYELCTTSRTQNRSTCVSGPAWYAANDASQAYKNSSNPTAIRLNFNTNTLHVLEHMIDYNSMNSFFIFTSSALWILTGLLDLTSRIQCYILILLTVTAIYILVC